MLSPAASLVPSQRRPQGIFGVLCCSDPVCVPGGAPCTWARIQCPSARGLWCHHRTLWPSSRGMQKFSSSIPDTNGRACSLQGGAAPHMHSQESSRVHSHVCWCRGRLSSTFQWTQHHPCGQIPHLQCCVCWVANAGSGWQGMLGFSGCNENGDRQGPLFAKQGEDVSVFAPART